MIRPATPFSPAPRAGIDATQRRPAIAATRTRPAAALNSDLPSLVLLIRALSVGGAERQIQMLAQGLARRWRVTLVTLYDTDDGRLPSLDVTVISLHKQGRYDLLGPVLRLHRLLRRLDPAILYAFLPAQTVLASLVRLGLPRCRLVFGLRSSLDYRNYDRANRIVHALETRLAGQADLVIANSDAGRWAARTRGIAERRIRVAGNLIDSVEFQPDRASGQAMRVRWGISPNQQVIGVVARLDPMKGHTAFLAAAALLAERCPAVMWVVVGDGPPAIRDALHHYAASFDGLAHRLVWAGEQHDIRAVMNAFDVATLPSTEGEGFPNAVAEAMACGVPVVATDVGDCARIVGDTGTIVPPNDPARLAAAWEAVLAQDLVALGRAARQRITADFDAVQALERHHSLLLALLDETARREAA